MLNLYKIEFLNLYSYDYDDDYYNNNNNNNNNNNHIINNNTLRVPQSIEGWSHFYLSPERRKSSSRYLCSGLQTVTQVPPPH